jgi:NAD(P)-dependent dehydrogenase (short-subunit alcohol dehydrogenase family)
MTDRHRIALVTGAGSGIGKATATALAEEGFTVVLAGRKLDRLEQVAVGIGTAGGEALAVPCDVTQADQVDALFATIEQRYGRLDLLFNNAGVSAPKVPFGDIDPRHWRRVFDVNVTGAFLCARSAFRLMQAQQPHGGRIINNGSVSAHTPRPLGAAYTASKHAITGLTKSLALDGRDYDVACGQIDIGNAATEAAEALLRGVQQADGRIAAEPVMDLAAVTSAICYMAGLPLDANVQFMTIIATKMPFVGRG